MILYRTAVAVPKEGINLIEVALPDGQHVEMFECPAFQQIPNTDSDAVYATIRDKSLSCDRTSDIAVCTETSHYANIK